MAKFAQRFKQKKLWWQRFIFWKPCYESVTDIKMRVRRKKGLGFKPESVECMIYHQNNQMAKTVYDIDKECTFIGKLPNKHGVSLMSGHKYWYVLDKKSFDEETKDNKGPDETST